MIKLDSKKIWQSTEIIDLPYKPFEESDKTERAVLNHIANGIIKVSKNESRKGLQFEATKKYNFTDSECIVGIDVSNIGDTESSYLDTLFLVTKLYPFILLNCNISKENLLRSSLHAELKARGYILPIFSRVAPHDILFAAKRYGSSLVKLLSGERSDLDLSELDNLNGTYWQKNIIARFPGLRIVENKIKFSPDIVWLGIDSPELSSGLTALFNNNCSQFCIAKFCAEYNIDLELLEFYLVRSMLFGKGNDNGFMFRLLRKNIFVDLMRALVNQLEGEMIDRGVIDTTHSDFAGFDKFTEYHYIGKLFQMKDTFAFKLLSYIRQCFNVDDFDTIVVADNGKEKSLFELIPNIFPDIKTVRIMNYFENPIMFPFDVIESGKQVLVIVDVVNTGTFLEGLLKYLRETKACKVTGIFTFLLDCSADINKFFPHEEHKESGNFLYFLDKSLYNVKDIRNKDQNKRFNNYDEEAYLRFWNLINEIGEISLQFISDGIRVTQSLGHSTNVKAYYCHKLEFADNADRLLTMNDHLYLYLQQLLMKTPFSAIVIENDKTLNNIAKIMKNIDHKLEIFSEDDKPESGLTRLIQHKGILIITTAINIGQHTNDLAKKIKRASHKEARIAILTLFCRKNIIDENTYLSPEYYRELLQLNVEFFCYYQSNLPYYLVKADPKEFKQVESFVKGISN